MIIKIDAAHIFFPPTVNAFVQLNVTGASIGADKERKVAISTTVNVPPRLTAELMAKPASIHVDNCSSSR